MGEQRDLEDENIAGRGVVEQGDRKTRKGRDEEPEDKRRRQGDVKTLRLGRLGSERQEDGVARI
jgi:hypothetical protein